jgi:flavodoxin
MKATVVFDSYFGNTEKIARAMAESLSKTESVVCKSTTDIERAEVEGTDMLVLGSPTRAFQITDRMKSFLKELKSFDLNCTIAAAFDTRIDLETIKSGFLRFVVDTGGYAAKSIAKKTAKVAGLKDLPYEGFFVTDEQGPLKEGELERAANWAANLLSS